MSTNTKKTRARRGRSEGSIFQRGSDGLWVGTISAGYNGAGKRIRRTVYGKTKGEVATALRDLQQQADAGKLPDAKDVTLGVWLARWLSLIESSVEPRTLAPYRQHVERHIAPRLGNTRVQRLRPSDVEALFAQLLKDDVSPAMVRKIGTTLSVALNHAVRSQLIPSNPTRGVRRPKVVKPTIEVLDAGQATALVVACEGERLGALYTLMLDAGLRPGEALALTWPDIDFAAGRVTVTKSLEELNGHLRVKSPKTARGVRQIDLTPGTVAALNSHRQAMLKEGWDVRAGVVFVNGAGAHYNLSNLYRDSFRPLLKRAGLPVVGLYALRHTCATLLLLANVNPKVVSERLGHSSITLTLDTYSHVLPTMQRQAADVLARLLGGGREAAIGYS